MKKLLALVLSAALALAAHAQVQNMQAASGATGDLTKPTSGFNMASGQTLTIKSGAILDATNGSVIVPNSAAPSTTSFGQIAADNNAWATGRGAVQFFDGTANTYLIGVLASSTPSNGQVPVWNTGGTITWSSTSSVANPTALVGLTAVNGSASSSMRSDGAPALDQSIAPTWTGVHIFTPAARSSGNVEYLKVNSPADTGLTAGANAPGVTFSGSTRQHASNTGVTDQDEYYFGAPTYSFASATGTIANASTLTVSAAPTVGTNAAITNPFALRLKAGALGLGASGSIAKLSQSSGLLTINSLAGLKLDAGSGQTDFTNGGSGIFTFSGASSDVVESDNSSFKTWQGANGLSGRGHFIQRAGTQTSQVLLSVGTGNDTNFEGEMANGSYGSLTATETGRAARFAIRTYGGSTWLTSGYVFLKTTQAQSETARGTQVIVGTTANNATSVTNTWTFDQDASFKGTSPTGGLGYATGSGGAVTQGTNRTTGVTLNTITGQITLFSAAGTSTPTTFTVTDSAIAADDVVVISQKSGTDAYYAFCSGITAATSWKFTFVDTNGTTSEAPVFNFAIIRGSHN